VLAHFHAHVVDKKGFVFFLMEKENWCLVLEQFGFIGGTCLNLLSFSTLSLSREKKNEG
jgi:hypothetical protein